jgi:hypothetical protein
MGEPTNIKRRPLLSFIKRVKGREAQGHSVAAIVVMELSIEHSCHTTA